MRLRTFSKPEITTRAKCAHPMFLTRDISCPKERNGSSQGEQVQEEAPEEALEVVLDTERIIETPTCTQKTVQKCTSKLTKVM